MDHLNRISRKFRRNESGISSIEYALVASLIATACVAFVAVVGSGLDSLFVQVCHSVPAASC